GFFKRTVQNNKQYMCAEQQECTIDRGQRKRCPSCRFLKCLHVGMRLEAVRADRKRGGRNKFGPMYKRDRALKQQRDALIQDGGFRLDSGSSTHHRNLTFTTGFLPLPLIPSTSLPTAQPPHLGSLLPSTQYQSTSFSNWKSQHSNNAPSMPQLVMEFLRCDPDELQLQSKISARILQEEENGTPNTFSLMCVMADQTLFSIVEWARTSIFFKQLKGRENSLLLVTGQEMELSYVASHAGLSLASLVQRGQDLVEKLLILKVDRQEFACIKFLVLFNPDVKQLEDPQFVESVHEQAESSLLEYTLSTSSHLIGRFTHLLLCLSEIRSLSTLAEDYLNAYLLGEANKVGSSLPTARKTGTTICGIVFKDGVILGADTRATEGMVVADKNCSKIHHISPNIYCCGAGTAADTEMTTQIISSNLELHALSTGRVPRVATANRMLKQMLFRYQGHIGAALVLGGVDCNGPHLYSIYPHGSTDKLPYVTMGSGSLAAMAVFEDRYKPDMEEEDAKRLVRDAIAAGIFNDLGSGSNIDLCVITKGNLDYIRPHEEANKKGVRTGDYKYKRGTTGVLSKVVTPLNLEVVEESVLTMDTS
ncbi:hypothetical protein JOQ06_024526, partial [Pogonophryne albipinna]